MGWCDYCHEKQYVSEKSKKADDYSALARDGYADDRLICTAIYYPVFLGVYYDYSGDDYLYVRESGTDECAA
jgi:hypothetical protein